MVKSTILTGIRANSQLHIGHYFGALLPMIKMANENAGNHQINLFVPDLHSITTPIAHENLQEKILDNLQIFVAAGLPIDNSDVNIYRQSKVPAHSELAWILSCFTGFGEMSRMTQFKEKTENSNATVGLFSYPILMASDILLYGAKYIPVGEDQTQHLEYTRDIAERINNKFNKDIFEIPLPVKDQLKFFNKQQGLRIKDLANPEKKMSKSSESDKGILNLNDSTEVAVNKVLRATTDDIGTINYDFKLQPGISNLIDLYTLLSGEDINESSNSEWIGKSDYAGFKKDLAEKLSTFLEDLNKSFNNIDKDKIIKKLEASEEKMNEIATTQLNYVQKAVGLR